jgi:predicted ArsR family transcriptional regulator
MSPFASLESSRSRRSADGHGRVTIGDIVTLTGTSRNTLKQHFRQLLEKGHLVMHGLAAPGMGWHRAQNFGPQIQMKIRAGS